MMKAVAALAVVVAGVFAGGPPANAAPAPATPDPMAREAANTRVWFHPAEFAGRTSDIWSFDRGTSTGFRRSIMPTTTMYPVQTQQPFTFRAGGSTVVLAWTVSGGETRIVTLGYNADTRTMLVNVNGQQQSWLGCGAPNLPADVPCA